MELRDWIGHAACDGVDPTLFDPVNRHVAARAVAVCATCPVRRACLLDELESQHGQYGPWLVRGGLTPKERREMDPRERRALIIELRASI